MTKLLDQPASTRAVAVARQVAILATGIEKDVREEPRSESLRYARELRHWADVLVCHLEDEITGQDRRDIT